MVVLFLGWTTLSTHPLIKQPIMCYNGAHYRSTPLTKVYLHAHTHANPLRTELILNRIPPTPAEPRGCWPISERREEIRSATHILNTWLRKSPLSHPPPAFRFSLHLAFWEFKDTTLCGGFSLYHSQPEASPGNSSLPVSNDAYRSDY